MSIAYPKLISNLWVTCFEPMCNLSPTHTDVYVDVFDVFRMTTELTERVSNLQLPYNGVLAAFRGIGGSHEEPVSRLLKTPLGHQDKTVSSWQGLAERRWRPQTQLPMPMPKRRWNLHHLHQRESVRVRVWVMMDPPCVHVHAHGHETSWQHSSKFSSAWRWCWYCDV